ncbi:MAG: bifunctional riboflavin kinase/FAD synthetase [Gammaproteobacteria bacterium]|nr:bifunctional riboflavin kinase/FAD synthetase [Gammaproteobacteria bacterium]
MNRRSPLRLLRGTRRVPPELLGGVVTLGSFDGLHRGHQALIERTLQRARTAGRPALLLSFEPLPREFLNPAAAPARLTNFRERWRLLEHSGLDAVVLLRFDERLRTQSGAEFLRCLTDELAVSGLVVGHDFRFGRAGEANVDFLRAAAAERGLMVDVLEPVRVGDERVSSSLVREALAALDLPRAARLLGRPYSMRGRVVAGQQLGRTLGFPTANIRLRRRRIPCGGIFAVRVHGIGAQPMGGVASLGTRPTVGGVEPLLETVVFDFSGDLYGRELEVEFIAHLRDELRFESVELMVMQMQVDAREARKWVSEP